MRATLVSVVLVVVVVLAGCTAPGTTGSGVTTPGSGQSTATPAHASNGTTGELTMQSVYGVDANRTIERISTMLGVDYERPEIVLSINRTRRMGSDYRESLTADPFLETFGLADSDVRSENGSFRIAGFVDDPHTVVMNPNLTVVQAETTLAHELVHVVQWQKGWRPRWHGQSISAYRPAGGRDLGSVYTAMQEGTAEYVQSAYYERYGVNLTVEERIGALGSYYRNLTGSTQLAWAPYYYGLVYTDRRVANSTGIAELFTSAPVTTEQLLHNLTNAEEPPVALRVEADLDAVDRKGAQGELFARIALAQTLSRSQATEAAAGWGNDTLLSVETDAGSGFAWVTRWDSVADAGEFERALADWADRREVATTPVAIERVAPETVVLLTNATARAGVSVEGSNGTVRLGLRS